MRKHAKRPDRMHYESEDEFETNIHHAGIKEDRIRRRAYELHQQRGGTQGRDLDDWLQAEREIEAEMSRNSNRNA